MKPENSTFLVLQPEFEETTTHGSQPALEKASPTGNSGLGLGAQAGPRGESMSPVGLVHCSCPWSPRKLGGEAVAPDPLGGPLPGLCSKSGLESRLQV